MKCLGIAIKKNDIWYSVVEGSSMEDATLFESGKQSFQSEIPTESLMMNFSNIFTELITKFNPDYITYKVSLNVDMKQIPYLHYSLGVLNLLCMENKISINERSTQWIIASKKSKIEKCEQYFANKKFKNSEEMQATLIAWFQLG